MPTGAAGCELKAVASSSWGSARAAGGKVDCLRRKMGGSICCVGTGAGAAITAGLCWSASSDVAGRRPLGRGELTGLSAAR